MTRQVYQTEKDLQNEQIVSNRLESALSGKVVKMGGRLGEIDRCIVNKDNEIECVLEIKVRAFDYKQFPTIFISAHKIMAGMPYRNELGIPFYIAFALKTGIYLYNIKEPDQYVYKWDGRTKQTRDKQDIEIMAHIPMEEYFIHIAY